MEILTQQQVSDKCATLETKLGKKVYPLVYLDTEVTPNKQYVGFIEEPTRAAKMAAFDEMSMKNSLALAGEKIMECALIKEESHKAFDSAYNDVTEYDQVYLAGCISCCSHVKVLTNTFKKK